MERLSEEKASYLSKCRELAMLLDYYICCCLTIEQHRQLGIKSSPTHTHTPPHFFHGTLTHGARFHTLAKTQVAAQDSWTQSSPQHLRIMPVQYYLKRHNSYVWSNYSWISDWTRHILRTTWSGDVPWYSTDDFTASYHFVFSTGLTDRKVY